MRRRPEPAAGRRVRSTALRPRAALLLSGALAAATLFAVPGTLAVADPAVAATPAPSTGYDVSYPQSPGRALPPTPAFAIVGVNGGLATSTNPSLAPQLAWAATAAGTGRAPFEVYVNTANPGPSRAAWWPTDDRIRAGATVHSPYGTCRGDGGRACAWVYGASLAADDLQRGVAARTPARWWLDVEAVNSWSAKPARNRAALEGMAARLTAAGARVGLYALPHEFRDLIGSVPASSGLAALPSWLAGAIDPAGAAAVCTREPLAGGRVQLAQWPGADAVGPIDQDLACALLERAPKPHVSGAPAVGGRLTARPGAWRPDGVHLAYRWTRDGAPITGATGRTYRTTARDVGHRVTVVVTGTKAGFSRAERAAAAVRVHR